MNRCPKCHEEHCSWRDRTWMAQWRLHDPEGYFEWAWWTARKEVEAEKKDRRRQLFRSRKKRV